MVFICAVQSEASVLLRILTFSKNFHMFEMAVWDGFGPFGPACLIRSGMGRTAAECAAGFALERFPRRMIVSYGFAGGLSPEMKVGDLMLPGRLTAAAQGQAESLELSPEHLEPWRKAAAGQKIKTGTLLTAERLIDHPEEKRGLKAQYRADAVDLESYWIGSLVKAQQTPFLAVRAISDGSQDRLPPLIGSVDPSGQIQSSAAIRHLIRHPEDVFSTVRMALGVRSAEKALERFFRTALPVIAA